MQLLPYHSYETLAGAGLAGVEATSRDVRRASPLRTAPHKWVRGHTFDYELDLDMPINPHYQAEQAPESSPLKSHKTPSTLEPAPDTSKPTKAGKTEKPKRARLTPDELKSAGANAQSKDARTARNAASASTAQTGLSKDKPGAPIASKSVATRQLTAPTTTRSRLPKSGAGMNGGPARPTHPDGDEPATSCLISSLVSSNGAAEPDTGVNPPSSSKSR